jgi:hypothetical protein
MKWIVFALGFVLAFGGLVAISQGYDIVQVERGWTLVISGTTALSAGIITVALGFVVARIEALIAVSAKERTPAPLDNPVPARLPVAPVRAPAAEAADAAPVVPALSEPAPAGAPFAGSERSVVPDVGPRQEANEPDLSFESLGFPRPQPKPADEATAPEAAPPAPSPAAAPKERPRATFALPPRVPAKFVPPPGPWPSEPASAAAEPEAPAQATPAPAGNEHDWLELALAGIEPEENAEPKPEDEEAQRAAEPAPVPEAQEEPAAPAVVGRYEANGASYALFADGSIEAETDSGIYRFASMAELKEFIERGA